MGAVYEVAAAKPHEYRARGYTVVEWVVYCEGYYMALVVAVRVLHAAAGRFALRRRERRADGKAARTRAGAA